LVPEFRERPLYNDAIFDNILTIGLPGRLAASRFLAGEAWNAGRNSAGSEGHDQCVGPDMSDGCHGLAGAGAAAAQLFKTTVDARGRRNTAIGMTVSYPCSFRRPLLYFFPLTLGGQVNKLLIDMIPVYFVGGSGNIRIFASVKFELNTALVIELSFPLYQISGNC
jgi:hypothetical protein